MCTSSAILPVISLLGRCMQTSAMSSSGGGARAEIATPKENAVWQYDETHLTTGGLRTSL